MNKKIVGIFIMTLLIGTTIPVFGTVIEIKSINENDLDRCYNYEYVAGEFIVKFKESPISSLSIDNLNDKYNIISIEKIFSNSEGTSLDNIYILKVSVNSDILSIVSDYSMNPNVVYAEPNYVYYPCGFPNDESFNQQWYLNNDGQTGGTIDADIDAPEAWNIETGNPDIVIAIVDTGVDYTHPDLVDNIWINEDEIPDNDIDDDNNGFVDDIMGWDFFYDDNDPLDGTGHGTVCAGIAGAEGNNNIGIAGVCWNCKIMPVRIANETFRFSSHMWDGLKYAADNGANVISMSFGSYNPDSQVREEAINYAYDKGCVLVAAAGNDGNSKKSYPAAYDNVISVGGTNHSDNRMNLYLDDLEVWVKSNWGDWVDIAAPAVNIFSTSPTYPFDYEKYGMTKNYFHVWAGTSLACPIVAGVAGLLLSWDSTLSQGGVKTLICENVDSYDSQYYIGTGRINAYKALSALTSPPNKPNINGPTSGKVGEEQVYIFSATDPYEDNLSYIIDWGDESDLLIIGPFGSGVEVSESHIWTKKGDYAIKVKARDIYGAESDWAILEVTVPKNKVIDISSLLQRFFYHFSFFEKILKQII